MSLNTKQMESFLCGASPSFIRKIRMFAIQLRGDGRTGDGQAQDSREKSGTSPTTKRGITTTTPRWNQSNHGEMSSDMFGCKRGKAMIPRHFN